MAGTGAAGCGSGGGHRYGGPVSQVSAATAPTGQAAASPVRGVARFVVELPDRLPVVLACLVLPALVATLVGQFRPVVVLPAWVLLVALTRRLVPAAPRGATPGPVLALLALVGAWAAWGVAASGEYLVVNRDPGFLTLKAWWLVTHPSARIPVGSALQGAVGGASAAADGFTVHGSALLAQGNSAVPALLATVGWAGGQAAVLWANVLVGAVAIVAVHAVARRLVGPRWAVLAAVGVAVTLPMLAFTRSAYTEPLVLALTFGGVALLLGALERPSRGGYVLAGGMVGAAGAARIDGAMVLAGGAIGLACLVLAARRADERRALARHAAAALVVMGAVAALGLVDLAVLSPSYLAGLSHQLTELLGGTVLVLVAVAVLLATPLRDGVRRAVVRRLGPLGTAAQVAVVLAFAVLATRPWWMTAHGSPAGSPTAVAVAVQQAAQGLPVDGTRTYGEQTVTWLAWYVGWPTVVAAVAGGVLLVRRVARRREVAGAVLAGMAVAGSALYLLEPAITPDQVWAVRRLLPVALPTVVLLAVLAMATAWARRRWPWRLLAAALVAGMLAVPVVTWYPVAAHGDLDGQLSITRAICDAIDRSGAHRVVWVTSEPWQELATLRVVCGVDVVETPASPSSVQLAAIERAWGDEPVLVLSTNAIDLGFGHVVAPLLPAQTSSEWARSLVGPPRSVVVRHEAVWAGFLGPGGTLTPVTAADLARR